MKRTPMKWQEAKTVSGYESCAYGLTRSGRIVRRFTEDLGCVSTSDGNYEIISKEDMDNIHEWFSERPR